MLHQSNENRNRVILRRYARFGLSTDHLAASAYSRVELIQIPPRGS